MVEGFAERLGMDNIHPPCFPFMKNNGEEVIGVDIFGKPILYGLHLLFECSEQNVPKDENASIVLVNVLRVFSVMNPMRRWRYNDVFQKSELADVLGVRQYAPDQTDGANEY